MSTLLRYCLEKLINQRKFGQLMRLKMAKFLVISFTHFILLACFPELLNVRSFLKYKFCNKYSCHSLVNILIAFYRSTHFLANLQPINCPIGVFFSQGSSPDCIILSFYSVRILSWATQIFISQGITALSIRLLDSNCFII